MKDVAGRRRHIIDFLSKNCSISIIARVPAKHAPGLGLGIGRPPFPSHVRLVAPLANVSSSWSASAVCQRPQACTPIDRGNRIRLAMRASGAGPHGPGRHVMAGCFRAERPARQSRYRQIANQHSIAKQKNCVAAPPSGSGTRPVVRAHKIRQRLQSPFAERAGRAAW